MDTEKTDAALVRAVIEGDENAFAEIVERHMSAVYKFAYRYVRDPAQAEDVTQEAFLRTWKNLKKFDDSRNFKTWLFAIAKNVALDFLKKKKPIAFSQISEEEERLDAMLAPYIGTAELPDAAFERVSTRADLARAMGALPPAYRTVLAMRYNDNLKFREIAETLGEPIDTVKSKHRRGLVLLRKIIIGDAAGSLLA